ncbi:hypothetical protein BZG36_03123 [Bifiguratus adelaidae]|uniref:Alcohol dehydrogenase-like N-terminal domain-containing protein n=1 Tax=Bifiguratus adelaidae TaxID=1938954 RepID=A0A261Y0K7_9FUNG|nr:hypothetical protein BZG36_03123 [Bifiguratus adelaidae]
MTMKAAVLHEHGSKLSVEDVPVPKVTSGSVRVKVLAAYIVHYAEAAYSGQLGYPMTLPMIPGATAVGIIEEVGADTTELKEGDLVFCDPTVRARDNATGPSTILQGLFTPPGGLTATYGNGAMAEQMLIPLENVVVLPKAWIKNPPLLVSLTPLFVPFGGIIAANFQPGQTLLVLGATGNFGSPAVLIALAMGAKKVIIPGRNKQKLDELVQRIKRCEGRAGNSSRE